MRGRRIEIDDRGTTPSLQIKAPKVMLKGQLAMSYNDDTVQIGLSPLLDLAASAQSLLGLSPTLWGVTTSHWSISSS